MHRRNALLAAGFVFRGVPCVGNSPRFGIERKIEIVAFRWSHDAVRPVVRDQRNPVTREIDGSGRLRGSGGLSPAPRRQREKKHRNPRKPQRV